MVHDTNALTEAGELFYNPLDPDFVIDPYPLYRRLRDEDPFHQSPFGFWVVSRHQACVQLLRSTHTSVTYHVREPSTKRSLKDLHIFLFLDDPDHQRLRALVAPAFSARALTALKGFVADSAQVVIDRLRDADEVDVVAEWAHLPVDVICHILGVDPSSFSMIRKLSSAMTRGMDPDFTTDEETLSVSESAIAEILNFFEAELNDRQRRPRDDLMSELLHREVVGDVTRDEIVRICVLLLIGGHETTVNLVGNGVVALLSDSGREQGSLLASRPELAADAVEELLRYDSPVQITKRRPTSDIIIDGIVLPKGAMVVLLIGSANRDERTFLAPDVLDVRRRRHDHLSFSAGGHHCLGARLARAEAEVIFRAMAPILPQLELTRPERIVHKTGVVMRGYEAVPVRVH